MANINHVVVLLMENRSFDELFGTFPGARGLNDPSPAIPQPFAQSNGSVVQVYPFRMSTFTSAALFSPHFGHDWNTMHVAVSSSQNAAAELTPNPQVWIPPDAANPEDNCGFGQFVGVAEAIVGYYAADDLPYLWALAQNFGLCDNFFSSCLAGTFPNRLYLTGGTINATPAATTNAYTITNENDPPVLGNIQAGSGLSPVIPNAQVPWGSYLSDLMNAGIRYVVYDDWQWLPPEIGDCLNMQQARNSNNVVTVTDDTLNQFWYYNDSLGVGGIQPSDLAGTDFASTYKPDPNYKQTPNGPLAGLLQFEQDAASGLPPVAWIHPPFALSHWPPYTLPDGSYYISRIVDAVINSPDWESTVLIIAYDETGTHFDHVPPPLSPNPGAVAQGDPFEPWANDEAGTNDIPFVGGAPIGAGMRVPAIVVSPWTFQGGILSDQMDLTSILQCMETVTQVTCSRLPPDAANSSPLGSGNLGWRRHEFANLHKVIDNLASSQNATPPSSNDIWASGFPTQATALAWRNNAWNRAKAPPATNETGIAPLSASNPTYSNAVSLFPTPPNPPVWPFVAQGCQIILPYGSYTLNQVQAVTETAGVYTVAQAIQVLVQGFEPTEFYSPDALNPPPSNNLKITNSAASCTSRVPVITFSDLNGDPVLGLSAVNPTIDYAPARGQPPTPSGAPQAHTFTFDLSFAASEIGALFPPTGALAPNVFVANAAFTVDCTVTASAELELVSTDDPQFYHDYTNGALWLSGELRVFSIPAGTELFGVTLGNTGNPQQDALLFISTLINTMNDAQRNGTALPVTNNFPPGTNNTVSSFETLNQLEDVNPLSLAAPPPGETGILNFALARVSMQAPTPAANVRVFFRSGRASVTTAAYDAGADNTHPAFYRNSPPTPAGSGPNDVKVPLLGVLPVLQPNGTTANEYVAIPFFAVPRIALNAANPSVTMQDQQEDLPNVARIPASSGDTPVETFFGCWLDINQSEPLFPMSPPAAPSAWDGPWPAGGLRPIQAAFKFDMHQCLIAEISFDPITIPPGDVPGVSAWLAQRNLGLTP